MSRRAGFVLLLGTISAGGSQALGQSLEILVGVANGGTTVTSHGNIRMLDANGTEYPSSSYSLEFAHRIHDTGTGAVIAEFASQIQGPYANMIGRDGTPFHCYQADLDGHGHRPSGEDALRTSHSDDAVCIPENPITPGGPPIIPVCSECPTGGYSPIVISLEGPDGDEFHMSGPRDPVMFDIAANGNPIEITWTKRRARVGFLAMDRNGNGLIDSGAELFGNHTPLANGTPPPSNSNGYIALASYDDPSAGGNGDGHIGLEDSVWARLRIWIDSNHDGVSASTELVTLEQAGIVEIGTRYRLWNRRDQYGNVFAYKSYAVREDRHGRPNEVPTYDVFFQAVN